MKPNPNHPLNRAWHHIETAMAVANRDPRLRRDAERHLDNFFAYVDSLIAENELREMRAATRGLRV